jgi:imidazole glycerol-phosphate synthase subunit HisH
VSPRIAVVDPGTANLDSMVRALEVVGGSPIIARLPQDLEGADRIVLPGVGAFPDAIGGLRGRGLDVAVRAGSPRVPHFSASVWGCNSWQRQARKGPRRGDSA